MGFGASLTYPGVWPLTAQTPNLRAVMGTTAPPGALAPGLWVGEGGGDSQPGSSSLRSRDREQEPGAQGGQYCSGAV